MIKSLIASILIISTIILPSSALQSEELIDAIVAVVDGEPITLSDLEEFMNQRLPKDLVELAKINNVQSSLDELIEIQILENEARERRININDSEIENYVNEIASRNNLTVEELDDALKEQGSSLDDFRKKTKGELLRTKLAGSILTREVAVAEEEAKALLQNNKELKKEEATEKIKLAQLFVSSKKNSNNELEKTVLSIQEKLAANISFAALVKRYSDASEKAEGGALPLMTVTELTPQIQDKIANLSDGQVSSPLYSEDGVRFFKILKRYSAAKLEESLVDEAKEGLRSQKIESALQKFFVSDMYKNHTIDKKI